MKKNLLIASMLIAGTASAFAVTDGSVYPTVDGFTCQNKWIIDRNNSNSFSELPFAEMYGKARVACIANDKVLVGYSKTVTTGEGDDAVAVDHAHIVSLDFSTGEILNTVQMTVDGEPVTGLLCANNVGCDQFGHIWFAGYVATTYGDSGATPLNIYVVDDLETGACHLEASLALPDDEAEATGRIDYCDVIGDVTRKDARCVVMCALASPATNTYVYGWQSEQDSEEWGPHMAGEEYVAQSMSETYPADQTTWSYAPTVTICLDDEYSGSLYYVDGFTTAPSLYDTEGTMIESFAAAEDLAPNDKGTNGVGEFNIGGVDFIGYSIEQYTGDYGCRVRVAKLGDNMSFTGMTECWVVPEKGLGLQSDGGTRYHAVKTKVYTDESGKQAAYLLTYKCANGIGVYEIAEEGFKGGVQGVIADENANAPVEYFNLQGVKVSADNLVPGVYVTRQGSKASKVLVK